MAERKERLRERIRVDVRRTSEHLVRQRQAEAAKECRGQASGLALARLRGTGPVSGLVEEEKLKPENSCSGAPSLWAFFALLNLLLYLSTFLVGKDIWRYSPCLARMARVRPKEANSQQVPAAGAGPSFSAPGPALSIPQSACLL